MTNFHTCLVCNNPSQTDIDGKGNGKRKKTGNDVLQSQLKSVFLLEKLLEVSSSTCVNLLRINEGSNPSSWFSCCWKCFKQIEKAEKVFNELVKLEKQWKNLKIAIQTKLHTSRDTELENSESVILKGKKKIEITVKTIRHEAFKSPNKGFTFLQETEKEPLNDVKIEVNEESVNAELVAHFSDNEICDDSAVGDSAALLKSKNPGKRKSKVDLSKRTRSGRIVKSRISVYESPAVSSSDEQNDWSDADDYMPENEIRSDSEEEGTAKNKIQKTGKYISKKPQDGNEKTKYMTHSEENIKCKHCGVEFVNARYRYLHEISAHENLYKLQCNHCLKKYTSEEYLHLHLKRAHDVKIDADPSCTTILKSTEIMVGDSKEDNDDICPDSIEGDNECDEESTKIQDVGKSEKKIKSSLFEFQCNHCLKNYVLEDSFRRHLTRSHNGKINPDPTCSLTVQSLKRRKAKRIVYASLFKFQCNHCRKKYVLESSLIRHLRTSHKGKINPDPTCTLTVQPAQRRKARRKIYDQSGDRKKNNSNTCPSIEGGDNGEEENIDTTTPCNPKPSQPSDASINTNKLTNARVVKAPKICEYCPETFSSKEERYAHQISAHKNVHNLHCNHCNKKYSTLKSRNLHIKNYHGGKIYPDPSCTLMLPSPRRERKKKAVIADPHNQQICIECKYTCQSAYNLKNHIARVHRKERNFICEICSKAFSCKQYMTFHQKFKHGDSEQLKSLQCKECGRILCDPQALRKHINHVHKKEFPYRCPICNSGKQCIASLDRHILNAHTDGPKPHACDICEKSYSLQKALEVHKRTHTGERPFKCPLCNKWFHDKKKMLRHKTSFHAENKDFQCEQCGSRFQSQHYLNSHVYSTHNKKKSSLPPKTIMDEQQLAEYVKSTSQTLLKKPSNQSDKKEKVYNGIVRKHIEKKLKQKELHEDETGNNIDENPCANPNTFQ